MIKCYVRTVCATDAEGDALTYGSTETSWLISDMMTRIKGGNPFNRPKLGKQCAYVTVGTPISVSDRWDDYQDNRRAAKQAVADLTQDLQTALQDLIV